MLVLLVVHPEGRATRRGEAGSFPLDETLQRACSSGVVTSLSSVYVQQVLEACELVGCAGDARLE